MTIRTSTLVRAIRSVCVATSLAATTLLSALPHEVAAQDAAEEKERPREAPIGEVVYVPVGETRTITSSAGWYAMTPEEELAGGKDPAMALPSRAPSGD